jgi:ubiquinone/menaquinone biosynthesis C-methylase UbiE
VRIFKARTLLRPGVVAGSGGVWADLGCGDGIFTTALYTLLGPDSEIYAVDKNRRVLVALESRFVAYHPAAVIHPVQADFTRPLDVPPLEGIVMANALHFLREKVPVVRSVAGLLKPAGCLIVVEYNTGQSNYAVPHPLDEYGFLALIQEAGLHEGRILARIPSTFLGEMYSGMAVRAMKSKGSVTGSG